MCDPGMTNKGPFVSWFTSSAIEQLIARIRGIPSSTCQVSKSECQKKPWPLKPGLQLIRL